MLTFVPNSQISTFRHTFFFRILSFPSFSFLFSFFPFTGHLFSFILVGKVLGNVREINREIIFERSTVRKLHKIFNGPF